MLGSLVVSEETGKWLAQAIHSFSYSKIWTQIAIQEGESYLFFLG